ncbi:MAG: ADP-forming succinate--CoA ligase subunit beta [Actinomycetota bacterium]
MDLYEHQGKELFRAQGIATPRGIVATTPDEASAATVELGGRSVVKVQVQVGGRGKGGGVVLVDSPERAAEAAARMLGSDFKGHQVTQVLCEELLPIAQEFYTSILLDRSGDYLAMMTAEGGMDIEELARTRPEALRRVQVDAMLGMRAFHVRELTGCLPVEAREGAGDVLRRMYVLLQERDATLVEVNPLVLLEDGGVVALDAKVTVDDNALFRHEDIDAMKAAFPIDPVQARANEKGLQYVKLDGNVGIIGNGAGLVMSTLDVVAQAGAHAANFLDVGGGASADQMATSLEVVLSDPAVKAVFINIFGGITRCDLVAEGVLGALERVDAQVPLVVRLDGTNAEEGRRILADAAHPRIVPAATMLEAAERAAALANGPDEGAAA